jgi:5'-deoxynucleotidase YfbR-like HD superfamily hydrolase
MMEPMSVVRQPMAAKPARAWQRMLSGRRLDLLNPSPLDVEIEDIAHGLSRVARWNGQTQGPYSFSVAQHAVLVEAVARARAPELSDRDALHVLLHDAAEYVIGDMISPFKAVLGGSYREVEARLMAAILIRFGLPPAPPRALLALTKEADRIAAYHEATELAGFSPTEAAAFFGAPVRLSAAARAMLKPWAPEEAKGHFLRRFATLDCAPERAP